MRTLLFILSLFTLNAYGACLDAVVLVHGNTASPSSWANTLALLKAKGYQDSELLYPPGARKAARPVTTITAAKKRR